MHKFSISGTHSTGKTTLVDFIAERCQDVSVVREVPRAICEEMNDAQYCHRDRNSFAKQTHLLAEQIAAEAMTEPAHNVVVTDRCVADHWAYTQAQFPSECSGVVGSQWEALVGSWMRTYDLVFLACTEAPLKDNGVRESDLAFQQAIDHRIREVLSEAGSQVVDLHGATTERSETFVVAVSDPSGRID